MYLPLMLISQFPFINDGVSPTILDSEYVQLTVETRGTSWRHWGAALYEVSIRLNFKHTLAEVAYVTVGLKTPSRIIKTSGVFH